MKQKHYIIILLIAAVLVRLIMILLTEPEIAKDSSDPDGYISVARNISTLDFSNYAGGRTPGYPALIALTGYNYEILVVLQMLFGICISLLLFFIMHDLTSNNIISFITALSYSLYLPFLNREIIIATETTGILLLTATFFMFLRFLKSWEQKSLHFGYLFLTVLFACLTTLVRPLYILSYYFIFVSVVITLLIKRHSARSIILSVIIMILPNIILIQGWSYVNKKITGIYTLSPWASLNLSNKVGLYIESAPNEYSILKKHIIKHRDEKIQKTGTHLMSAWLAFDDIKEETKLTDKELYEEIKKMSIGAIKAEPKSYLTDVVKDWWTFWKPIGLTDKSNYTAQLISKIQRKIFSLIVFSFFLLPFLIISIGKIRKSKLLSSENWNFFGVFYTLTLACSAACALLEPGNRRFSLVTDPLLVLVVIFLFYLIFKELRPEKYLMEKIHST